MENKRPVRCSENEEIALYLWGKRQEMAEGNGISENLDLTLSNAYRNICGAKTPIKSLKDLSQIKGVGKWILRLMQGFFPTDDSDASGTKNVAQKGKKDKGHKRYVPQKNSIAYALLITLYRAMASGSSYMKKQELIDAAEASGLSRTAIAPDKGKGKPGQFGCSPRDWYTGWSCMKTLISKGLVVKSSCPAKYMVTQEGQETARECLLRSGLADPSEPLTLTSGSHISLIGESLSQQEFGGAASAHELMSHSADLGCQLELNNIPSKVADRNFQSVQIDSSDSESSELAEKACFPTLTACTSKENRTKSSSSGMPICALPFSAESAPDSFHLRPCTSSDIPVNETSDDDDMEGDIEALAMPPCEFGERFEDTYDVILILDDRENFGSRSRKVVDNIRSQFNILVEVRRLPIGDGIWIVRHRHSNNEYVLDFIVERKKVDDLCSSIKDNRYRDQKLRLQRCGLQKLIYLVEGDPNSQEAAESIKTACFTTEILEGFDVQRTVGFVDTVKKYGYLTKSITQYYSTHFSRENTKNSKVCPSYNEFVKRCQDLEKMTMSDVFALQLMQVPQVTEEVALAVVDLYPTVLSLARAYSLLEGDIRAQEEMLKNQSKMISASASRNIFKLVWGS
ncbi:crossover junction endonuclease MUS81 isoform X2 [Phoenix dactylifera]|uniref:Crossover junction endonuclease MUS81 n=1 Tax=Phoenix dactylifera TaxID=42345 RepID=A0A8B8ZFG7_PHODC|nr:crossover junction endonuclease MUS81 isoform X2 [Phoenix dactylifera]